MRAKLLLIFLGLCVGGGWGEVWAQAPVRVEALSAFSWGANRSMMGNTEVIEGGQVVFGEKRNISLGAGNEFGLMINKGFDSTSFTVSLGFSLFGGKKSLVDSYRNKDSASHQYNVMESFQVSILLGMGFSKNLGKGLELNTDVGLSVPVISRIREERMWEKGDYWEQSSLRYRTSFMPGFWCRGGIAYGVTDNISLRSNVFFMFMNLTERRSEIVSYSASSGEKLNTRYPTVSDRETLYYSDITKVSNDPLLFPDTFDPNKPSESIKSQLPMSRIGISFSVVWKLNFENK